MDLEFLSYLSWREALVAIVVLLVLYILSTFLRISRMRNEARRAQEFSPGVIRNAVESYVAVQEQEDDPDEPEEPVLPPLPPPRTAPPKPAPAKAAKTGKAGKSAKTTPPRPAPAPAPAKEPTYVWEPPAEPPEARRIEALEREIAQLRRDCAGLRAEVQVLREEQRREMNTVHAARNASPFYSDAMQLAMRGREAADISALCGISRAEAELVVALARNKDQALG